MLTMSLHIALFRAVNVGGRPASSADLRALFVELGFGAVQTLLQSGNVVFEADGDANMKRHLQAAFEHRFGFAADILIRSAAEWSKIVAANPFPDEAARDPAHLVLFALSKAPEAVAVAALQAGWPGPERIAVRGCEAYVVYPDGIGHSKLTNVLIEKRLGVRGTGRNWNTALKLAAMTAS
jgi:uncharacterized protein (DUF1697 family)